MIRHAARIEPYEAARSLREPILTLAQTNDSPRQDARLCRNGEARQACLPHAPRGARRNMQGPARLAAGPTLWSCGTPVPPSYAITDTTRERCLRTRLEHLPS